jgi:predicted permease
VKGRRALEGLTDDIRDHIARETQENIERGMPPEQARSAALRKFGNVALVMDETRDVWRFVWFEQLFQDLRYALRFLRRNTRFTTVVVLTLALGIGMTTAVFSVANTVLLKPLPYPNPERLVWVGYYDASAQRDLLKLQDFVNLRAQARSLAGMAAYGYQPAAIATAESANQVTAVYVAGDFWDMVGAQAAAGRLFGAEEPDCLVLSWDLFVRQFGGDPQAIGRPVMMNGHPVQVTGVLPKTFRFQFPMWWMASRPEPVEAYMSLPPPAQRGAQTTQAVAALKPGVSLDQARAELETLSQRILEPGSTRASSTRLRAEPLQEKIASRARRALLVLLAAGAFLLLIASVNVANLLLARATVRQKDIAIRAALGAGRLRVIRQLLVENIVSALAGGIVGLLLARWAIAVLVRISPYAIPRLAETKIDLRVLAFTLGVSILTGILFGSGPAISLWHTNLHDALKQGARSSAGVGGLRTRRLLAAAELSLAIVLVIGAGLMQKSFARMNAHPPGLVPENVAVMRFRFAGAQYRAKPAQEAYFRELLRQMQEAPGVQSAGVSTWFLSEAPAFPADVTRDQTHVIRLNATSPGYLKALGVGLLRGRWLMDNDAGAALLNESMARQAFGKLDPIGRQLSIPEAVTIVGILADVKYSKLDAEVTPEVFIEHRQAPYLWGADIAARTAGDAASLARALRKRISAIDPSQPIYDVKTLEQALAESIAPRRFSLFLLSTFAVTALALALIGIYGVIAYSVAQRTREIGVRMALGATSGQAAALVLSEALPVVITGIVVGLGAAWGLTQLMATLLYDVTATDPEVFAAVAITLGITAIAACIGPAIKAAALDPTVALRSE